MKLIIGFLLISGISFQTVYGAGNGNITIKYSLSFSDGQVYKIRNVTSFYNGSNSDALLKMSIEDLDRSFSDKYTSSHSVVEGTDGKAYITGVSEGVYFGGEIIPSDGSFYRFTQKFFLILPDENGSMNFTVTPKTTELFGLNIILQGPYGTTGQMVRLPKGVFSVYNKNDPNNPLLFIDGVYTTNISLGNADLITDENGEIWIWLPPGDYIIKQKSVPRPYVMAAYDREVSIKPGEENEPIVFTDMLPSKIVADVKFRKVSQKDTSLGLEGAEFRVVTWDGRKFNNIIRNGEVYKVTSGEDGFFTVKDLEPELITSSNL